MGITRAADGTNWVIEFVFRGMRYRRSSGTSDAAAARLIEAKWRLRLREEAEFGRSGVASELTLDEAITKYITTVVKPSQARRRGGSTVGCALRRIRAHFGGGTLLRSITKEKLLAFRAALVAEELSVSTANKYTGAAVTLLRAAASLWEEPIAVPTISRLEGETMNDRVLTPVEEAKLLSCCGPQLADFLAVLIDTGCRRGELLAVKPADVLLSQRAMIAPTFKRRKMTKRRIPLSDRALSVFTRRLAADPGKLWPWDERGMTPTSRKGKAGKSVQRSIPGANRVFGVYKAGNRFEAKIKVDGQLRYLGLFKTREKAVQARLAAEVEVAGHSHAASLDAQWRAAIERSGLEGVTIHCTRHTMAGRVASRGASLYAVSKLLGHSSPGSVTARYAHLSPESLASVVDLLNPPASKPA